MTSTSSPSSIVPSERTRSASCGSTNAPNASCSASRSCRPAQHLVERAGQLARLVGPRDRDAHGQVPGRHALGAPAQLADRLQDRAREQDRELEGDREGHGDRHQHVDPEVLERGVAAARQPGHRDAGDDVDRRQRGEQPPLQRDRALAQLRPVGELAGDVGDHRVQDQLGHEEPQEDAVHEHDRRARAEDQERRQPRRPELVVDVDGDREDAQHDPRGPQRAQEVERQPGQRAPGGDRRLGRPLAPQPPVGGRGSGRTSPAGRRRCRAARAPRRPRGSAGTRRWTSPGRAPAGRRRRAPRSARTGTAGPAGRAGTAGRACGRASAGANAPSPHCRGWAAFAPAPR